MYIVVLILILILLLLTVILPVLLPLIAVVAVIALIANFRTLLGSGRYGRDEASGRRIEYTDPVESGPFRARSEEVEAPDVLIERPTSVRDDAFWEKDHKVLDVPFEEADAGEDEAE